MDQVIPVSIAVVTVVSGLVAIIYNNLNSKTSSNAESIKDTREKYVTKEEYNRSNDRLEAKLDKIIDLIIGERHER